MITHPTQRIVLFMVILMVRSVFLFIYQWVEVIYQNKNIIAGPMQLTRNILSNMIGTQSDNFGDIVHIYSNELFYTLKRTHILHTEIVHPCAYVMALFVLTWISMGWFRFYENMKLSNKVLYVELLSRNFGLCQSFHCTYCIHGVLISQCQVHHIFLNSANINSMS